MKMSGVITIFMMMALLSFSSIAQEQTHWYKDSSLYFEYLTGEIGLWKLNEPHSDPIVSNNGVVGEFTSLGNFKDYLSLVDHSFQWKKSDFDALAAFVYKYDCLVNFYGELLPITFPRDRFNNYLPQMSKPVRFEARQVLNMPSYGLLISSIPYREVTYIGGGTAPVEPSPKEKKLAADLAECEEERATLEDKLRNEKKGKKICIDNLGKLGKSIGLIN